MEIKIEYDQKKNAKNIEKHGVSFEKLALFEWSTAISERDDRKDYGEVRVLSYGLLNGRLHTLIWTGRNCNIRPISFRKANKREVKKYEKRTAIY